MTSGDPLNIQYGECLVVLRLDGTVDIAVPDKAGVADDLALDALAAKLALDNPEWRLAARERARQRVTESDDGD